MKKTATIIWIAIAVLTFFAGRGCGRNADSGGGGPGGVTTRVDTLVVRDTVRDTVLVAVERRIVRVDTVWLRGAGGAVKTGTVNGGSGATDSVRTAVPIERKVYATDDYRAVVEGFRPALVEMELYRKATYITRETTRTEAPKRWGIGIQAGYGFSPKGAIPYIGVGVQYRIAAW